MSGVGKGVTTASIAKIIQSKGFTVSAIKIDPYLNVDAGTMNPTEHGEVYVLDSGLETDQDMGNYERFLGIQLPEFNYMTSGMVYQSVINRERSLGYGGHCVEAVPHVVQEILDRIELSVKKTKADVTVVEIGGTIGDYQNMLFIEAARILKLRNPKDVLFVLVSYLPVPAKIGEMKTRPTQHAIRALNSYGINPDLVVARSHAPLDKKRKEKIGVASNIPFDNIISAPDIDSIYEVPLNFEKDGLSGIILKHFGLRPKQVDLVDWRKMVDRIKNPSGELQIAMVGKYFKTGDFVLSDVYLSVIESLKFAGQLVGKRVNLTWIDSAVYEENKEKLKELDFYDGVVVPGGFGKRGVEGIIAAIRYAREHNIPYFGLCYGMQLAVVEYARHKAGLEKANTTEIDPKTAYPVIDILPDQVVKLKEKNMGGTMRLGGYPAKLLAGSIAATAYKAETIRERHRHRYEVNPEYIQTLTKAGLVFSGTSPDGRLMEIAELPKKTHPFFLGTQFHPEFQGDPLNPHPLFVAFLKAADKRHKESE